MTTTGIGSWLLEGAARDAQTITARWTPARLTLIDGVEIVEVRNVPKAQGQLTEVFRQDWTTAPLTVDQVFQVVMNPGGLSAWHAHELTTDRLFVTHGLVRIALYDGREDSATRGLVNEFKFGAIRPALVTIPPRVWHGVQNIGTGPAAVLNLVDRAYDYERPDHWRVPHDSPEIPFRWS
jgi:dTDP-4-dehydrorhamnose 3,5-epimerase